MQTDTTVMKSQVRTLSVVLAVHNEEKTLPTCLTAVARLADELIVVDGASTDDTVKIARKHGATIISTTNKSNFHINKQMGIDAAKSDLVLQLDADEEVDRELASFISGLKRVSSPLPADAWYIRRKNFFLHRWLSKGGQYPDPVIRLIKNGRARLPMRHVHEQMQVDGSVATAQGHLLHYGNPDLATYLQKHNTYTSFTAQQWYDSKQPVSLRFAGAMFVGKPLLTFLSIYFRHKGFVDGIPGFVFALMSALHYPIAALKLWELYEHSN